MSKVQDETEKRTGEVFGELWPAYGDALFEASVQLFFDRLEANDFDRNWFKGKRVLDAGCGGGRNAIAMARCGADVVGVDLSETGLLDARKRARDIPALTFQQASLRDLPFESACFDMVWCAGVLQHTVDPASVLDELARVLKPGGRLYMLVYATGGMRWPLMALLRPLAAYLGFERVDEAIMQAGLAANKRRTFLDDLFTPLLDFYTWERLASMLEARGLTYLERWGRQTRFDHEASLKRYRTDLKALFQLFEAGVHMDAPAEHRQAFARGRDLVQAVVATINDFEQQVADGRCTEEQAMAVVIGQGHHRLWAVKA